MEYLCLFLVISYPIGLICLYLFSKQELNKRILYKKAYKEQNDKYSLREYQKEAINESLSVKNDIKLSIGQHFSLFLADLRAKNK